MEPQLQGDSRADDADDTNIVADDTAAVDTATDHTALVATAAGESSVDDTVSIASLISEDDDNTIAISDVDDGATHAVEDDTNAVDDATIALMRESKSARRSTREKSRTRRKSAQEALARRRGLTPPPLPGGRIAQATHATGPGSPESYEPRPLAPVTAPPRVTIPQDGVRQRDTSIVSVRKASRRYARAAMAALTVSWLGAVAAGVWIAWYLTRA